MVIALLWVLSPIDLIPEFLPIIGPLDDVLVVALAFRYAARQVPRAVLFEAWPADPCILERLLPLPGLHGSAREVGVSTVLAKAPCTRADCIESKMPPR